MEAIKKAEKALQAAARVDNIEEVTAEEKAERQAQKKKEGAGKRTTKNVPAEKKTSTQPTKASKSKQKVVRVNNSSASEGGVLQAVKQTTRGRTIKPPVVCEQGTN